MPDPLPQSILCLVLIGRDTQVAALARLLQQARDGHGQIAPISGKARLLTEPRHVCQNDQVLSSFGQLLRD